MVKPEENEEEFNHSAIFVNIITKSINEIKKKGIKPLIFLGIGFFLMFLVGLYFGSEYSSAACNNFWQERIKDCICILD